MGTKSIPIEDATEDQLRQFAKNLGLDPHPAAKSLNLKGKIATVYSGDTIVVEVGEEDENAGPVPTSPAEAETEAEPEAPLPAETSAVQPLPGAEEYPEPRYTIVIAETPDKKGREPVPVCVNGRNMWIPRGQQVTIKHRYYHTLMNAVQTIYEQPDGPTGDMIPRNSLSYPVQLIQAPSDEELAGWAQHKADQQAAEVARKQKVA